MVGILEAISDTNIGGAGILLLTRCAHMDRSRFHVTVALPRGSRLKERFQAIGVSVAEVDGCYDRSWDAGSIPKWISLLRSVRPALVNCHGCFSCRIAARICRIPVVVDTRHCAYPPKALMTKFPGKTLCGFLLRHSSDQTIAVAQAAKDNLVAIGADPRKIRVIINGAEGIQRLSKGEQKEIRKKFDLPSNGFVVGIFARLEVCKRHRTFLEAARILLKKSQRYRFLIVGDGSQRRALIQYARELGVLPYVRFCGFAEDVTPWFNVTDLQVNCSEGTETSSLALSEGMSLGIPSVVSDYGGNPYMVRDGENGYLFSVGRADQLADRIRRIAEDPLLWQRLSEGARTRFCRELNAERMTKDVEDLYTRLLRNSSTVCKKN